MFGVQPDGTNSLLGILGRLFVAAPEVRTQLLREREGPPSITVCLESPTRCRNACSRRHGGEGEGARVSLPRPQPVDPEVREWTHGWQFHASLLATPSLQHACTCLLCQHHKAGIPTWAMRFQKFHQPFHQLGDHFQRKSSARFSSTICICPSMATTDRLFTGRGTKARMWCCPKKLSKTHVLTATKHRLVPGHLAPWSLPQVAFLHRKQPALLAAGGPNPPAWNGSVPCLAIVVWCHSQDLAETLQRCYHGSSRPGRIQMGFTQTLREQLWANQWTKSSTSFRMLEIRSRASVLQCFQRFRVPRRKAAPIKGSRVFLVEQNGLGFFVVKRSFFTVKRHCKKIPGPSPARHISLRKKRFFSR